MSNTRDVDEFLDKNYPVLYQYFGHLAANADVYTHDRVERTIQESVTRDHPKTLQKAIMDLDKLIEDMPLTTDELAEEINYDLQSDSEALAMLIRLRDGLRDGLAARLKAEEKG
jgi:hypothetical protein